MSGNVNFEEESQYEEVPEVPRAAPRDERETELMVLRETLRSTQVDLANEHLNVLHLNHQCNELRRKAEAQEERADSRRKRRIDDNELFTYKLRKARAEAAEGKRVIENLKEEKDLLAMDLVRLRAAVPSFQEKDSSTHHAVELILCILTSSGAVETSFSVSADGKMKVGILVNDKGMPRYYAAYGTSETCKINALSISVCFCGFLETEVLQQELRDRGVVVPK
ncbi:hypothetical protein Aduo_006191 [Ancylostoma duodenale]